MAAERVPVEPAVLRWARTSMRLSAADAARKIAVPESTLERWESGDLPPTVNQLRKAANVYRRPLAVLLLPEPPPDLGFSVPRDYREGPDEPSPELITQLRRAHEQRDVMAELADLIDLDRRREPIPRLSLTMDPDEGGRQVRDFLEVSIETQLSWRTPRDALNGWIEAAEAKGILVVQTSRVATSEVLGFSLHGEGFPVVGLNGSDPWPRRKVFTLLHEIAHLGLGHGGLCDLHESPSARDDAESFCNRVAAAALLPKRPIMRFLRTQELPPRIGWSPDALSDISAAFGVSQEAVLLRLIVLERATWDDYARIKPELDRLYREASEAQQERMRESPGGPSYYVLQARNLGRSYTHAVLDAYHADAISSVDVANYLGIRFQQLPKLEEVS